MASNHEDDSSGVQMATVTWRDIYKAVEGSEARIIATIKAAVEPLTSSVKDHEDRIRYLELNGSSEAKEALHGVEGLIIRVAALELGNVDKEGIAKGRTGVFVVTKQMLLMVAAILGMISVTGDLLARWLGW